MKKIATILLLACLLATTLLPLTASAQAVEWICSDCHIWVSGEYCPQCSKPRPAEQIPTVSTGEGLLTFRIAFEENLFLSKHGVEVLVNGEKTFVVSHGESLDGTVAVPVGKCEVVFRLDGNPKMDSRYTLNITGDTTFTADMSTHFYGVEMENVDCPALQADQVILPGEAGILNGVQMTLVDMDTSRGNSLHSPADGYVFVMVEFEVTNMVDDVATLKPDEYFVCYCDGYTIRTSARAAMVAPMGFGASLREGEKMKSMLCFELPKNWQELRIVYGVVDDAQEHLVFVISNK